MEADFTIKATDGILLAAKLFLSEQEKPYAEVVMVHGPASATNPITSWKKKK